MQVVDGNVLPLIILVVWLVCFVLYSRELVVERNAARRAESTDDGAAVPA